MDVDELVAFIDGHYRRRGDRLFRMEVLPEYLVDDDGDDYSRWLKGASEPTWSRKQSWLDVLRRDRENGMHSSRVRIFSERLTDYERYACHFGYLYNVEFEDIRVLRRGEHAIPGGLVEADFWVINDTYVVLMHYDECGRFEAAERLDQDQLDQYLHTRDTAMAAAEPFRTWWARHPELHRRAAA